MEGAGCFACGTKEQTAQQFPISPAGNPVSLPAPSKGHFLCFQRDDFCLLLFSKSAIFFKEGGCFCSRLTGLLSAGALESFSRCENNRYLFHGVNVLSHRFQELFQGFFFIPLPFRLLKAARPFVCMESGRFIWKPHGNGGERSPLRPQQRGYFMELVKKLFFVHIYRGDKRNCLRYNTVSIHVR